jgi:hypothetical protein
VGLQQGFATGEMGFNDKFAVFVRFGSWLFSNSGRALALITADLRPPPCEPIEGTVRLIRAV